MTIQILGGGCPNCTKLAENARIAAQKLKLDFDLEKITDYAVIAEMGVMKTPALAVDGKVLHSGSVASAIECERLLSIR